MKDKVNDLKISMLIYVSEAGSSYTEDDVCSCFERFYCGYFKYKFPGREDEDCSDYAPCRERNGI